MRAMYSHEPDGYDCPMCAIVSGRFGPEIWTVPGDIVLQAGTVSAWISPRWWVNNPGHVIVVPDVHVENIYSLDWRLAAPIHDAARRVAIAFKQGYGCDGVSTRQHNEPAGNQDVWHYHLHVFPRYVGDQLYGSPFRSTTPEERAPYADKLRGLLG